jgi:hypothetical protein
MARESPAGLFRFNASIEAGGLFDGRLAAASVSPAWNTSRHLKLSGHGSSTASTSPNAATT